MYYNNLRISGASILVKIISNFFHKRHKAGDVSWPKGASTAASQPEMLGSLEMWGPGVGQWRGFMKQKTQESFKGVTCWWLAVESSKGKGSTFLTAAVVTMSDVWHFLSKDAVFLSYEKPIFSQSRCSLSWGVACIQVPQHQRNLSISKLPPKLCVIASKGGCHDESHGSYVSLITWTTAFWRLHPGKWTDET